MANKVQIALEKEVFEEFQRWKTDELIDDSNIALRQLVDFWDQSHKPNGGANSESTAQKYCILSRGEHLPVGLKLKAQYLGHEVEAYVGEKGIVCDGEIFDNPSSAGIRVKQKFGAIGNAASTNGWTFFKYFDERTHHWGLLGDLRSNGK